MCILRVTYFFFRWTTSRKKETLCLKDFHFFYSNKLPGTVIGRRNAVTQREYVAIQYEPSLKSVYKFAKNSARESDISGAQCN